jgi:hypothetical protein
MTTNVAEFRGSSFPGSTRRWRVGDGCQPSRTFATSVRRAAEMGTRGRVRSPDLNRSDRDQLVGLSDFGKQIRNSEPENEFFLESQEAARA